MRFTGHSSHIDLFKPLNAPLSIWGSYRAICDDPPIKITRSFQSLVWQP